MIIGNISSKVMLVIGVAATLAACLVALMWWKSQPAEAVTDPGRIAFTSNRDDGDGHDDSDIYTMNPDGSGLFHFDRTGDQALPAISPDGNKIAYVGYNPYTETTGVHVMNSAGSGQDMQVLKDEENVGWLLPAWSPDGSKLVVNGGRDDGSGGVNWDLYTVNADGTSVPNNVTDTPDRDEIQPSWSSTGKIAFASQHPEGSAEYNDNYFTDIYSINADGTGRTQLTNTSDRLEETPSYSPDGSQIAYTVRMLEGTHQSDIYTMNSDGSQQTPLQATDADETLPFWSPDGTQLTFSGSVPNDSGLHDTYDVFKINATGTGGTNLTENSVLESDPSSRSFDAYSSWGPSPSSSTVDTTEPALVLPDNITATATGSDGAVVTYDTPTATDENPTTPRVTCSKSSGDTFPLGNTTVTCSATDAAGNTAIDSFTVKVLYDFAGFFAPVDNTPTLNVVKAPAGKASIQVRFSLATDMGLDIFDAGYPLSKNVPCPGVATDEVENTVPAEPTNLKYDTSAHQYIYTWKTDTAWKGTCRELDLRLKDGTDHQALFKFTK